MCLLAVALLSSTPLVSYSSAQEPEILTAEQRLDHLRTHLRTIVDRYHELRDELGSVKSQLKATELKVRKLAQTMLDLESRAVTVARDLYKGGGISGLETLVTSNDFTEVQRQLKYLEATGQHSLDVFGRLANDRRTLEQQLDVLDDARARTFQAVTEMADIRAEIAGEIATRVDEIERLDAQLAEEAEQVIESSPPLAAPPVPSPSSEADWDAIAMCESGGNWHLDSTYDGGLQFHPQTWLAYGGGRYARYAWQATREQQIAIAEKVLASQGPGAWPNCFQYK